MKVGFRDSTYRVVHGKLVLEIKSRFIHLIQNDKFDSLARYFGLCATTMMVVNMPGGLAQINLGKCLLVVIRSKPSFQKERRIRRILAFLERGELCESISNASKKSGDI